MSHNVENVTIIEPRTGWSFHSLIELRKYIELLYILTWREIMIRYKQSVIGVAWVIFQPLVSIAVFSVIFGKMAGIPSNDIPYPIFSCCGLIVWLLFQRCLTQGSMSLVVMSGILTKIYFPRIVAPCVTVLSALFDFVVSFTILVCMMIIYQIFPGWQIIFLPFYILLAILSGLGVALWLSALNIRYRDIGHIVPFLGQIWMFLTPVVYPLSMVPLKWQFLYSLNPMVGVIEGFRWVLLDAPFPNIIPLTISLMITLILCLTGYLYFDKATRKLVDYI